MKRDSFPMIRTVVSRTRLLAVPLLALSLLLTGCSAGSEEPNTDPPGGEPNASGTPGVDAVVGLEECIVGSWKVDNAAFEKFMNTVTGVGSGVPAGVDATVRVSGGSYMRFDGEGAFSSWRDDYTFAFGSGEHTVTHVSNSGETGDYGVVLESGGKFTTDFLWVAETMIVMTDEVLTVGGIAQAVDRSGSTTRVDFFDGFSGDVPIVEGREALEGSLPFQCDGDLLTFEFDAGLEMPFHRTAG